MREVADVRIHAGTGERPLDRLAREAAALRPLNDRPAYQAGRSLLRKVHSDACVEVDTHRYSVPWRLIGAEVRVEVQYGQVRILAGEQEVAAHDQLPGRGGRSLDPAHLEGIVSRATTQPLAEATPLLLRPMSEYQDLVGAPW